MAVLPAGTIEALVAAYVFGIVFTAASATLFLNVIGHGSSIFRDGKRLVLNTFLLTAALWAQIDFIATLISPTATSSCQIGVIFTTLFDQLARFSIEQHLLWVISHGTKAGALQYIMQALLTARFILGIVFVVLSKPDFNLVCVSFSSVSIVAVIVVAVDAVVLLGLFGQAIVAGVFSRMADGGQSSTRGKAVIAVMVGLALWMGTSVAMLLGQEGSVYLVRSTIPGGGLAILIITVAAVSNSLVAPELKRDQERRMPEAPSPRMNDMARSLSTSDSNDFPPSRYEDLKSQVDVTNTTFEQPGDVPENPHTAFMQHRDVSRSVQPDITNTAFVQPRDAPQPEQATALPQDFAQDLTSTTKASAGQGVFGVPVQGVLFPPMRAASERPQPPQAAVSRQAPQQPKRAFLDSFESRKGPARAVTVAGKLAISNPILQEGGSNPLEKVATTDLATAAEMDRRKRVLLRTQTEPLVTAATAIDQQQGPERSTTLARKGLLAMTQDSRPDSETLATMGTTSGAQLSPAGDELRRRSPRQLSPVNGDRESTGSKTRTPPLPPKSPGRLIAQMAAVPGSNPVVGPSEQGDSPPGPVAESQKPLLQRSATTGLPSNPRSKLVRTTSQPEAARIRQETVLLVNDIVYNDPTFVASVMEDAKDRESRLPLPSVMKPDVEIARERSVLIPQVLPLPDIPTSPDSVVNRPRPIPRKPAEEEGDSFYPPTGLRRSRSLGNLMLRQSALPPSPGSPTDLPPLPLPPPPPKSATIQRPHPNDTKSMTYSEKVSLLFPSLSNPYRNNRRSSTPDLQVPFMDTSPTLTANETRDMRYRESKQSASTSTVRTTSIFNYEQPEPKPTGPRGSALRNVIYAQGAAKHWQEQTREKSNWAPNGNKRASSPLLPIFGALGSASSVGSGDDITNIGSIYSPRQVQQVGLSVHQARAIEVTRGNPESFDNRVLSVNTSGEELPFMLDTTLAIECNGVKAQASSDSPVDEVSPIEVSPIEVSPVDSSTSTSTSGSWHRRIGDETLSFSADKRHSKRGPPPTPLALSDRPTHAKQAAMAKAAEPSPLPSPAEALEIIQAQLRKYEEADRGSTSSTGRQALLNDLEAEMGQQELQWLGMQSRFTQGSLASVDTSPTAEEQRLSQTSPASSMKSMRRRTRRTSVATSIMSINDGDGRPFSSRASLWQRRLAAAHQEFMHTADELDQRRSRNFLALSSNLGSPTASNSDESETEIESTRNLEAVLARRSKEKEAKEPAAAKCLWTAPQQKEEQSGLMWMRPAKPYHVPVAEPALPGLWVRPAQRRQASALTIHSHQLWTKPAAMVPTDPSKLWVGSAMVAEPELLPPVVFEPEPAARNFYNPGIRRSQTVSGRPLTQRPPRRSRRITALPDIIEDPVPLPDKRDTLGIYQFPWGEKSDIPFVPQTAPAFRTMPGTMSTGRVRNDIESRSRDVEQQEYSSSFFDEYEEDDSESDSMGSDSDDGFDETTLFEIASLLKTNDVPSNHSFFGLPRDPRDSGDSGDSLVDQYMTEEPRVEQDRLAAEERTEGLQMMPSQEPGVDSLWEHDSDQDDEERGAHGQGLPQPQDWHRHDDANETVRAKPRLSQQPASIDSDNLWVPERLQSTASDRSPMWTPSDSHDPTKATSEEDETASSEEYFLLSEQEYSLSPSYSIDETASSSPPLWKAEKEAARGEHGVGLQHPQNWASYDDASPTVRAKTRLSEPAAIESGDLWAFSELEDPSSPLNMWTPNVEAAAMAASPALSPRTLQISRVVEPSQMLWSAPSSPQETTNGGLFDSSSSRSEFRTSSEEPAAIETTRKTRSSELTPLDRLDSDSLWAPVDVSKSVRHWLSAKTGTPVRSLWSAPASPTEDAGPGLFSRSARTIFRTTSRAAAAVELTRKLRSSEDKSLDQLTSTALWASGAQAGTERHWISIGSLPRRALWSAPVSPTETAAPGLFAKSDRSIFKTTSQKPAALEMERKPRSVVAVQQAPGQLASTSLWASQGNENVAERNWIDSGSSSGVSTPEQASRMLDVTPEMWQTALDDAVAASYPALPTSSRSAATSEQWQETLDQAVTASYPVRQLAAVAGALSTSPREPLDASRDDDTMAQSSAAAVPRGRRIMAMATMFDNDTQVAPLGRSLSITRKTAVTPPRPASPELQVDEEVEEQEYEENEEYEEYEDDEEYEEDEGDEEDVMDPALLAQIEALEQERLFAEQWAAGAFEDDSSERAESMSPVLVPSIPVMVPSSPNKADALAREMFTPTFEDEEEEENEEEEEDEDEDDDDDLAPFFLEPRTYQVPANQQQALSAEQLGEQMSTPKDGSPVSRRAPSLPRADSENIITLRDSMIGVGSDEPRGSKIQFK